MIYKGKGLCQCLIDRDMNLEEALEIYCKLVFDIKKEIDLKCVKTGLLGIDPNKLTCDNLLADILNSLIAADISINGQINVINQRIQQILNGLGAVADEKVKASATDTTAGYLDSKIETLQPGTIKYTAGKLSFIGFAPVGTVMFINKSRLPDFDGTGKGKAGTDVWGWAIGNGQNGTVNRLGVFPRYTDDPANAGNKAGSDSVTLVAANIPGFSMSVTGTISEALTTPVQFDIKLDDRYIGVSGSVFHALQVGNGQNGSNLIKTIAFSLKHSHAFDLQASRTNTATSFSILPSYIKEIPIERIPV